MTLVLFLLGSFYIVVWATATGALLREKEWKLGALTFIGTILHIIVLSLFL